MTLEMPSFLLPVIGRFSASCAHDFEKIIAQSTWPANCQKNLWVVFVFTLSWLLPVLHTLVMRAFPPLLFPLFHGKDSVFCISFLCNTNSKIITQMKGVLFFGSWRGLRTITFIGFCWDAPCWTILHPQSLSFSFWDSHRFALLEVINPGAQIISSWFLDSYPSLWRKETRRETQRKASCVLTVNGYFCDWLHWEHDNGCQPQQSYLNPDTRDSRASESQDMFMSWHLVSTKQTVPQASDGQRTTNQRQCVGVRYIQRKS